MQDCIRVGVLRGCIRLILQGQRSEAVIDEERREVFQRFGLQVGMGVFQCSRDMREIHVGGEVGFSRAMEDADLLMTVDGLEGVSGRAGDGGAVVQKDGGLQGLREALEPGAHGW